MLIDHERSIRRWPLDKSHYVTPLIVHDGILIHNIFAYKLNKQGF